MAKTLDLIIGLSLLLLIAQNALALRNPAAVYCESMGYEYVIESYSDGEFGYCQLEDGEKTDGWKFLTGEAFPEKSYCVREGHALRIVHNMSFCQEIMGEKCAACVLDDGREVEVTKLMGLSFKETICGDGVCGLPEDYLSCPKDCPKGGLDGYCDNERDGICDLDCPDYEDPDCKDDGETSCFSNILQLLGAFVLLVKITDI